MLRWCLVVLIWVSFSSCFSWRLVGCLFCLLMLWLLCFSLGFTLDCSVEVFVLRVLGGFCILYAFEFVGVLFVWV